MAALERYMLELSERMGMTLAELGRRMSAKELTMRRALDMVRDAERRAEEEERAAAARRRR